jgi:hypothetical protein
MNDWIAGLFDPRNISETIDLIMAAQDSGTDDIAAAAAKAKITDANQRMARYKAVIDAGGDPAEIGAWITEARAQRVQAEADLRQATSKTRITRQQVKEMITTTTDIAATLRNAETAQMAGAYRKLGVRLTYDPAGPVIRATASPQPDNIGKWFVSEVRLAGYVHTCDHWRVGAWEPAMTGDADRWIRWTTTGCVALLALIAGTVSYLHMHMLVELHGQPGWIAALTPLSVDGMIVAASTTLLADSRSGRRGGALPWVLLVVGSVASLVANVAVAEPSATGRVIAAWPSFALIAAYELLMRQVRRSATGTPGLKEHGSASRPEVSKLGVVSGAGLGPGRALQRQAWEWARANRAEHGSLPSGREIALQFGRHERWGRLVKRSGCAGDFRTGDKDGLHLTDLDADEGGQLMIG